MQLDKMSVQDLTDLETAVSILSEIAEVVYRRGAGPAEFCLLPGRATTITLPGLLDGDVQADLWTAADVRAIHLEPVFAHQDVEDVPLAAFLKPISDPAPPPAAPETAAGPDLPEPSGIPVMTLEQAEDAALLDMARRHQALHPSPPDLLRQQLEKRKDEGMMPHVQPPYDPSDPQLLVQTATGQPSSPALAIHPGSIIISAAPPPEPAAPSPGSASALAQKVQALPWSKDEDAIAVAQAVAGRLAGKTWHNIGEAVAAELGRPLEGTKFRLKNVLLGRIEAGMPQTSPVPPAAPQPAPAGASPVEAHLLSPRCADPKWIWEDRAELMRLAILGLPMGGIATELERDVKAIQKQFDLLTFLEEDDKTGRKARRFGRQEVADAIDAIIARTRSAQAAE